MFCQNQNYKPITTSELELYRDLIKTIKDDSFIVHPLIYSPVDLSMINTSMLIIKYGFTKKQFKNTNSDTILIENNKYFKIINPDSLFYFKNYRVEGDNIFEPFLYAINKIYHKEAYCQFYKLIFSSNGTFALAEYFVTCGDLCGYGETVIMKRTKGKWLIIKRLTSSIS